MPRSRPRVRVDDEPQRPWPTLDVPVSQRFARLQGGTVDSSGEATAAWLGAAAVGTCTHATDDRMPGRCDVGNMGSWALTAPSDWWDAAEQCLHLCRQCRRCRVLSVSLHYQACSWHASCDVHALHTRSGVFLTAALNSSASDPPAKCLGQPMLEHAQHRDFSHAEQRAEVMPSKVVGEQSIAARSAKAFPEHTAAALPAVRAFTIGRFPADERSYLALCAQAWAAGSAPPSLAMTVPFSASAQLGATHLDPNLAGGTWCSQRRVQLGSLDPACMLSRLSGQWILFAGDSTQRMVHDALLDVLDSYGASCLTIRPHVAGMPIADADGHKDYDSVCLHPDVARTRAPSRARQPPAPPVDDPELPATRDPERQAPRDTPSCLSCLPLPNWTRRPEHQARVRVSMRFLRGLDPAKLAHNALDWRQRLHYVEWASRSARMPANLVLSSDPPEAHPVSRAHFPRYVPRYAPRSDAISDAPRERHAHPLSHSQPDVIVFHSCGWDLPRSNRSAYLYEGVVSGASTGCSPSLRPSAVPSTVTSAVPSAINVSVLDSFGRPSAVPSTFPSAVPSAINVSVLDGFGRPSGRREAPVLPTPCIRRGDDLADDEIFEGYRGRLDAAIRHLRTPSPASRRAPRLIVRNCHAGTRDSRRRDGRLEQPQLLALQRMNAIIAAVASEHAVELLDVYELDRIAGFATEAADENFHVTQPMATSAAFALLLMLSGVGSSGVYL
jgi:hypothetical protein